jgi:hypothetical protein
MIRLSVFLCAFILVCGFSAPSYKIGKLKYNGGGDWYANRSALQNLVQYCNKNFPFIYMTGHGNVQFSDFEAQNLRKYLIAGGFLHIDDNYGMDKFIRPQMKKVFPELSFVELPSSHAVYQQKFKFPSGLPKIHEHEGKRPQGLGLIYKGRLVCYYTYETDLGNGWEDAGTYAEDTPETREKALKMGANLVQYALTQ